MRIRPQEPTAALAALITGNHRFLREPVAVAPWRPIGDLAAPREPGHAGGLPDPPAQGSDSGRLFALVWSREERMRLSREVFGLGEEGMSSDDGLALVSGGAVGPDDAIESVEEAFGDAGVPLVVVIARLETRLASLEPAWARAESQVFDGIRQLLGGAARVRAAAVAGRTRVVGALVEDTDGRVHWLGELPDQERVLGATPRA